MAKVNRPKSNQGLKSQIKIKCKWINNWIEWIENSRKEKKKHCTFIYKKISIKIILKNKNYIGVFEYNGKKEKNDIVIEIEPIVSRYMWNKVNLKK